MNISSLLILISIALIICYFINSFVIKNQFMRGFLSLSIICTIFIGLMTSIMGIRNDSIKKYENIDTEVYELIALDTIDRNFSAQNISSSSNLLIGSSKFNFKESKNSSTNYVFFAKRGDIINKFEVDSLNVSFIVGNKSTVTKTEKYINSQLKTLWLIEIQLENLPKYIKIKL